MRHIYTSTATLPTSPFQPRISAMANLLACSLFVIGSLLAVEAAVSGNGVNLQPSYYNGGNVQFGWDLMKQYNKIKTVRIEIEPDVNIETAKSWIKGATSNGINVIATYHKYTILGSDDVNELLNAANWWKQNWANLASAGPFTINMINEWGSHNLSPGALADGYNRAIDIVRGAGYQVPSSLTIF